MIVRGSIEISNYRDWFSFCFVRKDLPGALCEIILNSITTSCTNGGVTRGVHDGKLKMIVRGGIDILDYRDRFPFFSVVERIYPAHCVKAF